MAVCGLGALLLIAGVESRRQANLGKCVQQLRQLGAVSSAYAADNNGLSASFSWQAGDSFSEWDDLNDASSHFQAAINQMVDIARRHVDPSIPYSRAFLPHLFYSYLVLADEMDLALPRAEVMCPEDEVRRCWQSNWASFCDCPLRPDCEGAGWRWPFSSSYELGPTFFAGNQSVFQAPRHSSFFLTGEQDWGGRRMSRVKYPSQKAMIWESTARHSGPRDIWHAYDEARTPIVFVDGSVSVRATADANEGWHPMLQKSWIQMSYFYRPDNWEAPTLSGEFQDFVVGHYRWTRNGLAGRDFGGPEDMPPG